MSLFDRVFRNEKKIKSKPKGGGLGVFGRKDTYKIGDKIGNEYKVEAIFGGEGKSGMGIVYKVKHEKEPLPLALKTFQGDYSAETTDKLRQEVNVWASLEYHPNIVKVRFVDELDFRLFVGSEFIVGPQADFASLRDAIQFQHIRIRVAVSWAKQFCDAMNFAMKLGLQSHRDIKPENLLIDQNGVLKVTDFGMASMVGEEGHRGGTLPYMAPEQFNLDQPIDHRADIYAFGVILYELVSGGKYPYIIPPGSRDLFRTYAEIHRNAEVRIQQTPLNQIVKKCMQKNPAKRYQTFGAFRSDILKIAKKYNLALMPVPRTSADEAYRGRYAKALVYRENGKLKECTALLRELQKEDPTDPGISNELGLVHYQNENWDQAIKWFEKAVSVYESYSVAWNNLGLAYKKVDKYKRAWNAFTKAIEADPANSGAYLNLISAYFEAGKHSEAVEVAIRALHLFPQKMTLVFSCENMAEELLSEHKMVLAVKFFSTLVEIGEPKASRFQNLAVALIATGQEDDAIGPLTTLLKLEKDNAFAIENLIRLYVSRGDVSNALTFCDIGMKHKNTGFKSATMKAQLLCQIGKLREGIGLLDSLIRTFPREDSLYFVKATELAGAGQRTKALLAAKKSLELGRRKPGIDPQNLRMCEQLIQQLQG